VTGPGACYLCGSTEQELVFRYDRRPEAETDFGIPPDEYHREFWRCGRCGLMAGLMDLDPAALYEGAYVDATYTESGLARTFDRIMGLPPEGSDNTQRVRRIVDQLADGRTSERTLLDVGSGLGVFPARMKQEGWACVALDPDPRAVEHARERIGVEAVQGDFIGVEEIGSFSLVTLNKVLEHVPDPVEMLERCHPFIAPGGTVYVEVPDGELASADPDGADREEFYIEHLWAFSATSLSLLADRAGFVTRRLERVREPSDKYTLFAFLEPGQGARE
jgi:SAM-dependent methyltransferase